MRRRAWLALMVLLMTKSIAYAAGGSIPHNGPVFLMGSVSSSLEELVGFQERVSGYFLEEDTIMFYAGNTDAFQAFLDKYAKVDGIEEHRLVIREGQTTATAPWDKQEGKSCDWVLKVRTPMIELAPDEGIPTDPSAKASGEEAPSALPEKKPCVAELTIYTKGQVDVKKLKIPESIFVDRESQTEAK